ncbi:glycosyltransferase [Leptolyngbya sp. FACHB-261]|uniref:glycosyltransferase n=1 Tax=Leptolyngbya sp. FACHB-261 TaxID=2692806 RepID=UPI001682F9CA|nr:glycosyltransferase [Leptolyngbya sp. FACHB-261]MBD2101749.1 glycosyltransferase [Leptolyngbya sp. FACHB-261]
MKIAQIIEATGGGTGRHVLDIVDGLHARGGHELHLLHSLNNADATYRNRLQQPRPWLHTNEVDMKHPISPVADAVAALKLADYLRKKGPFDAVHLHSSKAAAVGGLAARLAGVPQIVFTPNAFVSMGKSGYKKAAFQKVEGICARLSHRVIAVSPEERNYAIFNGVASAQQVILIPNCIQPPDITLDREDRARLRAEWGIGENTRVIGSIGRFILQKDPALFIETIARRAIRYTAQEEMYIMGGTGDLEDEVKSLIARRGLEGRVKLIGFRTDMDAVLSSLDIFVLHSRYEGMPLTILEAMGHALPVVSTDVPGVSEPLEEGGIVVEIGNPIALDHALDRLADADVRKTMGELNRARVKARYSISFMIDCLLKVYAGTQLESPQRKAVALETIP